MRFVLVVCVACSIFALQGSAQQTPDTSKHKSVNASQNAEGKASKSLTRFPIEWIIGPYIPIQQPLQPLTNGQREQIFIRQTFLTAGSYIARAFSAGIDQARGEPHAWGAGMPGYGRRYLAVVQNSLVAVGNGLLGYEPRYDFCHCDAFWPRTLHAISRNFLAYNRTDRELRPQVPAYVGAFISGLVYNSWLPGHPDRWKGGATSMLSQAAIGSGYNFVSELSLDILHAFGLKKHVGRKQPQPQSFAPIRVSARPKILAAGNGHAGNLELALRYLRFAMASKLLQQKAQIAGNGFSAFA